MAEVADWRNLATTDFASLDPQTTIALQPVGAIEQHGPHLPLATDAVIAEEMARISAAKVAGPARILILPTTQAGKSNEHIDFPGTLTLGAETLTRLWTEIGESVARAGVRKIVFLNAHGGQPQVMQIVCRELRVRLGVMAVATDWSSPGFPDGLVSPDERRHGIHGGQVETAMMLALRPDLVRMEKAADFEPVMVAMEARYRRLRLIGPMQIGWQAQDVHPEGVAGNAAAATPQLGATIVDELSDAYAELLEEIVEYPLSALKAR